MLLQWHSVGANLEQISEKIPGRNVKMCKGRMRRLLQNANPISSNKAWTDPEIERLESLRIAGKSWAEISLQLDGRTQNACQLEWRLIRSNPETGSGSRWTEEEDAVLRSQRDAGSSWQKISRCLDGRSSNACEGRWIHKFNSEPRQRPPYPSWAPDEENLIRYLHSEGMSWEAISDHLPSRTTTACRNACYRRLLEIHLEFFSWTSDEDTLIVFLCDQGASWEYIGTQLYPRTVVACQKRWDNYLHTDPTKIFPWTLVEDKLLAAFKRAGMSEDFICTQVPWRTEASCRERWENFLNPVPGKQVPWTQAEIWQLRALHYAGKSWSHISMNLTHRGRHTADECRLLWLQHNWNPLADHINSPDTVWTQKEETRLKNYHDRGWSWDAISIFIHTHSAIDCRTHWISNIWEGIDKWLPSGKLDLSSIDPEWKQWLGVEERKRLEEAGWLEQGA